MATSKNPSQVSEFYLACRNGDVEFVKDYLMKISPTKYNPNHLESSVKSTPLHAASYYGHKEIVQLLIEHGCDRSQTNGYGLTAYEEAANDEIRQLFKRPMYGSDIRRFQDETTDNWFDFVKRPKENVSIYHF
jgi:ankyrin repeat protein